jgi:hypothetical protein
MNLGIFNTLLGSSPKYIVILDEEREKNRLDSIPPSVELEVLMCHEDCGQALRANVGKCSPELLYEVLRYKLVTA